MKIAVPSSGTDLNAPVDARFGRAAYFLVIDDRAGTLAVVENQQNLNAPQGAGIQAGEAVVRSGADVLLAGNVGPKAFAVLHRSGVKIYLAGSGTVGETVAAFREGRLDEADAANVEGHW